MPLLKTMKITGAVLHGGRQLLAVHHEFAVAGKGDDGALGMDDLGGHAGRHAIAHGAAGRRQLGAQAAVAIEAVQPRWRSCRRRW